MGSCFSSLFSRLAGNVEVRVLMLGLDNAGKTTILYSLKLGKPVTTIPTVGFNVESMVYKSLKLNMWDVGGQDKIRPLWRHYYAGTTAVVYVVDSRDTDRIEEARVELHRVMIDRSMKDCPLLIFANKKDQEGTMGNDEVESRLQLSRLPCKKWHVQSSCAISGDGLIEGVDWLVNCIKSDVH